MKKMRSSEQTKRWNRKGFSLAETLVTLLILSFVMGGIVSGSSAALKVYRQARRKADAQTLLSTAILALSENLYYSKNVSYDSSFQVTGFDSETTGYRQTYANGGTDGIYIVPPALPGLPVLPGAQVLPGALALPAPPEVQALPEFPGLRIPGSRRCPGRRACRLYPRRPR